MKFIKNNIIDILSVTGLSFISVGLYMIGTVVGFIGVGALLLVVSYIIAKGGV